MDKKNKCKDNKFKKALILFLSFFKIGCFTFGGGIAMIPIIQAEVVDKRKWLKASDILDILAISESTPGPIAINTATYVGYRVAGVFGSFMATLGIVLPSFTIIYIISLFYETFMSWTIVANAFKGLNVGVILLLIFAILSIQKAIKWNWISFILFLFAFIVMVTFTALDMTFSFLTISIILIGMIVGIIKTALDNKNIKGGKK